MVNCYIFVRYDAGKPVISRVVENALEVFYLSGGGGEVGTGELLKGIIFDERPVKSVKLL